LVFDGVHVQVPHLAPGPGHLHRDDRDWGGVEHAGGIGDGAAEDPVAQYAEVTCIAVIKDQMTVAGEEPGIAQQRLGGAGGEPEQLGNHDAVEGVGFFFANILRATTSTPNIATSVNCDHRDRAAPGGNRGTGVTFTGGTALAEPRGWQTKNCLISRPFFRIDAHGFLESLVGGPFGSAERLHFEPLSQKIGSCRPYVRHVTRYLAFRRGL
jgi:hypothetical protein